MKKIRITESELVNLVRRIIKEDSQSAYFTQKVTGQEMPHDADDMAPDGMDDDSDVNEEEMVETEENVNEIVPLIARAVGGAIARKGVQAVKNYFSEDESRSTFNEEGTMCENCGKVHEGECAHLGEQETGIMGVDDAGSALDTMSYVNPDASGFQSQGPMDSYDDIDGDDEAFV
jgi:hypothetical protein